MTSIRLLGARVSPACADAKRSSVSSGAATNGQNTVAAGALRRRRPPSRRGLDDLQPAALAREGEHSDEHREHHPDDDPEGPEPTLARDPGVHAPDPGHQRQREEDHREHGEHAQDVVELVGEHRLVGVLERLGGLLVALEHLPDALGRVVDVVEVEVEVVRDVARLGALQVTDHRALRADDLAEVDDLLLDVGEVANDLLGPPLEDVLLEALELVAHLAQHRKGRVDAVVDDLVEQVAGALGEHLVAELRVGAAAFEQVLDGLQGLVGQRDHEVAADEQVQLGRVEPPDVLVETREVQDDEQVVVVLVDLRALVAREDVLVVQRVEVEVLLQPGAIAGPGPLDMDPAQAVGLDGLDVGGLRLGRAGWDVAAGTDRSTKAGLGQARHWDFAGRHSSDSLLAQVYLRRRLRPPGGWLYSRAT